jgi:hypothetical protein
MRAQQRAQHTREDKKMQNYFLYRDGKLQRVMPLEKKNGRLWNNYPLLDGVMVDKHGREKIAELSKARKFDEIPDECYAVEGENPSGLLVISCADLRAQEEAAMTPAQKERIRISGLYAQANRRLNADDDCNTMDYYRIKSQADGALKKWRTDYPTDAAQEKADDLKATAADLRSRAQGALLYDCDGSIDAAGQQQRHDDFIAQAEAMEKQAVEIINQ